MDTLLVKQLSVDQIFLDPNNPRFWTEQNTKEIPERRIADQRVQSDARVRVDEYGVHELYHSIMRNGFLLLDRIVVRPIIGSGDKYVVVEGNRRFRSLMKLRDDINAGTIDEDGLDDDYLDSLLEKTNTIEVLVYNGGAGHDISWMLQGIRHISGIKAWEPAQRARLVAEQIDDKKQTFRSAGQQFGLSPQAVGRLYRTYKALMQMREDEDFGSKARNDYFTLFEEAYRNGTIRQWLEWSDDERKFENTDKLKTFYSWITPDDEQAEHRRRIHDPRQIKELAYLIENDHRSLLANFDQHELTIGEAYGRAVAGEPKAKDWKKNIETALEIVADLPQSAMFDEPAEFVAQLDRLMKVIIRRKKAAEQVLDA